MTAQDRLKQYFYEHIINHKDFIDFIEGFNEENENLDKKPILTCFDDIVKCSEEEGWDWDIDFDIDVLDYDFDNSEDCKNLTVYIYQVEPNVFISIDCKRDRSLTKEWYYDFDTVKYVKQVKITRTEWQPIS